MKIIALFSLLLIALVGYTSAQCPGQPETPNCLGLRNVGRRGRGCVGGARWYYDSRTRQCREMRYLGCGGNNNRWCSLGACEESCRRT